MNVEISFRMKKGRATREGENAPDWITYTHTHRVAPYRGEKKFIHQNVPHFYQWKRKAQEESGENRDGILRHSFFRFWPTFARSISLSPTLSLPHLMALCAICFSFKLFQTLIFIQRIFFALFSLNFSFFSSQKDFFHFRTFFDFSAHFTLHFHHTPSRCALMHEINRF